MMQTIRSGTPFGLSSRSDPRRRRRVPGSKIQGTKFVDRRSNFSRVSLFSIELAFLERAASPSSSPFFAQSGLTYSLGGRFFGLMGDRSRSWPVDEWDLPKAVLSLNEESERWDGKPGLLVSLRACAKSREPKPAPLLPPPAPDPLVSVASKNAELPLDLFRAGAAVRF